MPELPISPVLAWFLVGVVFFTIEFALPGFIIFFFGIGAWCAAMAVYLIDLSLSAQLMVFLVASILSLLALRSYLNGIFRGKVSIDHDSVNVSPATATGVVIEDILPPAEGKVKYGGSFWRASAEGSIKAGTVVTIVEQQDLLVKVQAAPIEGED